MYISLIERTCQKQEKSKMKKISKMKEISKTGRYQNDIQKLQVDLNN